MCVFPKPRLLVGVHKRIFPASYFLTTSHSGWHPPVGPKRAATREAVRGKSWTKARRATAVHVGRVGAFCAFVRRKRDGFQIHRRVLRISLFFFFFFYYCAALSHPHHPHVACVVSARPSSVLARAQNSSPTTVAELLAAAARSHARVTHICRVQVLWRASPTTGSATSSGARGRTRALRHADRRRRWRRQRATAHVTHALWQADAPT